MRVLLRLLPLALLLPAPAPAQVERRPFPVDWDATNPSLIDLSGFLDAPAGKDGFLRVEGAHLVRPDGTRFRIWGVNVCAMYCFPDREQARRLAADLARLGFNCVRFHHMDASWGRNLFDPGRGDTRRLDPDALDRLDFLVAELKRRGIYSNLNLNVSRHYKPADGVRDAKLLGPGRSATYFNDRLVELQHEFARQLLTHRNPYTGNEYRHEPAVAVVEIVNENSVLEGWCNWRLVGKDDTAGGTWGPIPVSYAQELTERYNRWLRDNLPPERLAALRTEAGVGPDGLVPRLAPNEFAKASRERFHAEASFYMALEHEFFTGMRTLLKDELGVRPLVVATADHNDGYAAYGHIKSNLLFDVVDGHGYWEHPRLDQETWIRNTPMVNDPLDSTVTQFARTPVAGRPFTISEVNHPFPHKYACEGYPILTAYALLHDWDGLYWFEWGPGRGAEPVQGIPPHRWFSVSTDPVKLANLAACGLAWHRRDVRPAMKTVTRSYTPDQVIEALRLDRSERPFFTPGFARSTALQHATRFRIGGAPSDPFPPAAPLGQIVSDTGELAWYGADRKKGVVAVRTDRTQALVGFVREAGRSLPNFSADVNNDFCALVCTSLDGQPLARAEAILLAATASAAANTG